MPDERRLLSALAESPTRWQAARSCTTCAREATVLAKMSWNAAIEVMARATRSGGRRGEAVRARALVERRGQKRDANRVEGGEGLGFQMQPWETKARDRGPRDEKHVKETAPEIVARVDSVRFKSRITGRGTQRATGVGELWPFVPAGS